MGLKGVQLAPCHGRPSLQAAGTKAIGRPRNLLGPILFQDSTFREASHCDADRKMFRCGGRVPYRSREIVA